MLICGGAPLAQEVKYFLMAAFCCPVLEAYGTSETGGGLSTTSRWDTRAGFVGGPLASLKLRLKDIPELGYLSTDQPCPRGEICIKGAAVCTSYFRSPSLNAELFDKDGWLRLGDVGTILPGGAIQIIDRVKSVCKL